MLLFTGAYHRAGLICADVERYVSAAVADCLRITWIDIYVDAHVELLTASYSKDEIANLVNAYTLFS